MVRKILFGYETVANYYMTMILNGTLEPGGRMPTVGSAAADWGVSKHTVMRAYWKLRDAGLIEILRGNKGTLVKTRGNSPAPVDDLRALAG
jgi:DNA-binding transcriptional regulator YhcF (GntR family)